jgi:hypothetical protein
MQKPDFFATIAFCCLLIVLCFSTCYDTSGPDVIVKKDTMVIKGKPDTLIVRDTIIKTIIKPKPYAVFPTPISTDSSLYNLDSIRIYTNDYVDDSGHIQVYDSVRGVLLYQSISATLQSKVISKTDTVVIKVDSMILPKPWSFFVGGTIIGGQNQANNLFVTGSAVNKNKQYQVGYDPFNKSFLVGFGIKIK